jgi:hypothetical protein
MSRQKDGISNASFQQFVSNLLIRGDRFPVAFNFALEKSQEPTLIGIRLVAAEHNLDCMSLIQF